MRLIDADKLKEDINSRFLTNGEKRLLCRIVDKVLTVDIPTELCKGCRFLKDCETCEEKLRPQGEWIKNNHTFWTCNKCNFVNDFNRIEYSFCPNCGAAMRKGGEELKSGHNET